MFALEQILIEILMLITTREELNAFLRTPQNTAILLGSLIAVSGALLGTFLLLRGLALTSDAISHTVLLGIVVAFIVMTSVFGMSPDLSSPWLILGATIAGVVTVVLTEAIHRSGLVKQDAALGLTFPLLFAIAVILISRYADNIHLDTDSVLVGEIGMAWANTNSHCTQNCETVTITSQHPQARFAPQCINCRSLGITPRDEGAEFREICINCGDYSPAQAWQAGLIDVQPVLIFFPKSLTVMLFLTTLTLVFIVLFYKELKLSTFDRALASSLGFRPQMLHYALMIMVSLVAVGAFDAVGSILVIAFFIIPPATAYLLTNRLAVMLFLSPVLGVVGVYFGYGLARGDFLGLFEMNDVLVYLNETLDLGLIDRWDSSISASMVLMIFLLFITAWVVSPQYGLISTLVRRLRQRQRFDEQVVLGHIYNHRNTMQAHQELAIDTLHYHFRWSSRKMWRVMARLYARRLVRVSEYKTIDLTRRGEQEVSAFRQSYLQSS